MRRALANWPLRVPPRLAGKGAGADVGAEAGTDGDLAAGTAFFPAGPVAGPLCGAAQADKLSPSAITQAAITSHASRRVIVMRTSKAVAAIVAGPTGRAQRGERGAGFALRFFVGSDILPA